jgi:hypothetical protein
MQYISISFHFHYWEWRSSGSTPTRRLCQSGKNAPMHFLPSSFCWAKPKPSGIRSRAFNISQTRLLREAWECLQDYISTCPHHRMEEWFIIQSFYHGLTRSTKEHIDATVGGSFFALNIEEARVLTKNMASSQSWIDEHTQSRTRKVHQFEEVDMLTAKIYLLMKTLEDPGLDHLKMIDSHMMYKECREKGHMVSISL